MSLEKKFELYKEKTLSGLWIHYKHIESLIINLDKNIFKQEIVGYSENNIPIHKVEVGKGALKILLWSQMHGDESTATKGLFDLINYITATHSSDKQLTNLLQKYTLVFIPLLNPDGAAAYTRENADKVDLNRDAQQLKTKEGSLLNSIVTAVEPSFAFNLHDQTSWYNVANTDKVATMSFLSPAAESDKKITKARREAMRVIVCMYNSLQAYLPDQIGRYDDTFCTNCFGDRIQQMGFPTILVESGYYPGDESREQTRKFHFVALLSALFAVASDSLPKYEAYFDIPMNEKLYYDVRYDNIVFKNNLTSIAVRHIYKIKANNLIKIIDPEESISAKALENKLFHQRIDAKGMRFEDLS